MSSIGYSPISDHPDRARVSGLLKEFEERFGRGPTILICVPGRVNLIGEHVDYCGYAVLPKAIEQSVLVAVAQSDSTKVILHNTKADKYPKFECDLEGGVDIDLSGGPKWHNYFLCGIKGVLQDAGVTSPKGMWVLIDGTIPPSAGLSSSSALVVAAAFATQWNNGKNMSEEKLADLCAKSERFIGTQGGGMDQAIEILARSGKAKLIEFNPLRTFDVELPDGAVFVIANSLAESNKAAGSDFNTRVAECKMATKVLGKALGVPDMTRLGDLQKASGLSLRQMIEKVDSVLKPGTYSKQEIIDAVGVPEHEIDATCLSANTLDMKEFRLRDRAMHVFSEAQRVYDFKAATESTSDLATIGELMSASHGSCSQLYECSHPAVDKLVELAKKHGALGARLTGAGWGGCIVALLSTDKVGSFLDGMKEDYYQDLAAAKTFSNSSAYIFPSQPGSGAKVYQVKG